MFVRGVFAGLAAACLLAVVVGETANAQNPPARGMRWSKAAPFPEPEEELYGTVLNGKFYVILPSMPTAVHGNAMGFIGRKLHVVSGKMEGGGAPDMAGTEHPYATASHDVLDIPSGTQ